MCAKIKIKEYNLINIYGAVQIHKANFLFNTIFANILLMAKLNKWFHNCLHSFASGHTDNKRWQPPWKRPSCTVTWELKVPGPSQ